MGQTGTWATASGTSVMTSSAVQTTNPNCAQTFASLRLYGDALVAEQVSLQLGLPPTECAERGDKRVSFSGKTRAAPTGRWILQTEGHVAATELQPHIEWLLDRIESAGGGLTRIPRGNHAAHSCV